jgi:lactoylglutathione lyase
MKFGYTILYVDNVEAALSFYERAFGLQRRMIVGDYGELDTGATTLSFAARAFAGTHFEGPIQQGGLANPPAPMEVALVTDDVPAAFEKAVAAGARRVQNPEQKPWGQVVGYVRDNNGFLVEICSPVK